MTVNKFRKAIDDEEVIALAKSLIKAWKKLLNEKETKGDTNNSKDVKPNKQNVSSSSSTSNSTNSKPNFPIKQTSFPADTTNSVRLKCREMLADALKYDESLDEAFHDPEDLAIKIEDCIYKEYKDTGMKYKNRIRSRLANLKDTKNPDLKMNVLRGVIKPDKIAVMTAEVCNTYYLNDDLIIKFN